MNTNNILLGEWELPPFDRIHTADFEPAVTVALAEAEANIDAITDATDEPTFANTIEALEVADRRLQRIASIMINLNECCTTDELQEAVMRVEQKLAQFSTSVSTNRRLYDRARRVPTPDDPEQRTLLEQTLKGFERHGIALEGEEAERYKRNEIELAELKTRFGQNALADLNAWTMHLTDEADLAGLPETTRTAARHEAEARGLDGWLFTLAAPSYMPFMANSSRRDLRERMYRAYCSIGNHGDEHDNNAIISRLAALRAEQASLLGYENYCDYVVRERMVGSLERLRNFEQGLHDAVLPHAEAELHDLEGIAEAGAVMPWDVSYLSEQLRQRRYDFDSELLRPYFRLEAVRDGIFGLYGRLYGLKFVADATVPTYHDEVSVYRVEHEGREMGLLYLDMHPRPSKRSGAWMTEFRGQYGDTRPQIQVVCNFSRPTGEQPALLLFSEVETFMHEMGHAMHGMLSQVRYESLSGTNVWRDFVEMPSQLMENWCYEPEFLATFARHYRTGEVLPTEYIDKIRAAQNHMAAWLCLRQVNLGLTDIAFHTMTAGEAAAIAKAEAVEAQAMTDLVPRVEGCCTATNFGHIFGGGYASGYYGYKWAEVLEADIFSRFKRDGIFNTATASELRDKILSRGGTENPALLFRSFMGRDPDSGALLKRMGIRITK